MNSQVKTNSSDGQRISKTVGNTVEWYVRDATGNIMVTYQQDASISSGNVSTKEFYKYGSNLLAIKHKVIDMEVNSTGDVNPVVRGEDGYILTDHLGNTRAIASDKKIQVEDPLNPESILYYEADVKAAYYYSAYGAISNKYGSDPVVAFNGQHKSGEIGVDAQTALYWEYNGDVGRRWNVDPRPNVSLSSYTTFVNNPILNTDFKGDTIFRPAWMKHTFEDPLKEILYKTPLGKQLLDQYANSSTQNIYFYAFNLDKNSKNFNEDNKAIMNAIHNAKQNARVDKNGNLIINNWDEKAREGGEQQMSYANSSGFNFNTTAMVNLIGLNTTDNTHLGYDKYDLAFAMYHEIYAHVKLANGKGAESEHGAFGNTYYVKGMKLFSENIVGGSLMVQGSDAWKIFKQILELKIKNGDGSEENKADFKKMNKLDIEVFKVKNLSTFKTYYF